MAKQTDKFANKFYGQVVESAANTLTFAEIPTNVDVFSKKAWILHKLEWYFSAAQRILLATTADIIQAALCSSDKLSSLDLSSAGVIDLMEISMQGVPANGLMQFLAPIERDFSKLPGGGLIISPRPLYLAIKGTDLAAAVTVAARGYFTAVDLNADEYLELVDFYRIVQ